MMAADVNDDERREAIGATEGPRSQLSAGGEFLPRLKDRELADARLFTSDKGAAMTNVIAGVFPEAAYKRCTVHLYRNVPAIPKGNVQSLAHFDSSTV